MITHVGDDLDTVVLPDTDTRVGGTEIDSGRGDEMEESATIVCEGAREGGQDR